MTLSHDANTAYFPAPKAIQRKATAAPTHRAATSRLPADVVWSDLRDFVDMRLVYTSNYVKRKWDSDNEELLRKCIDEVITRIDEIGDSPAGIIAAQDIIDIVTENLAPEIYNKGVRDAKKIVLDKLGSVETEVDLLEQHT